jgi:hypothetical protein
MLVTYLCAEGMKMPDDVMRAHVLMPRETVEAIDRIVGRRGRSRFLVDAAEEKLRRAQALQAADRVAGSLANEDTPGWNTPAEVQEWVWALRRDDNRSTYFVTDSH